MEGKNVSFHRGRVRNTVVLRAVLDEKTREGPIGGMSPSGQWWYWKPIGAREETEVSGAHDHGVSDQCTTSMEVSWPSEIKPIGAVCVVGPRG